MASISREPNGHRTIQFVAADGKRRSIRLGKISQHAAETVKGRVESLAAAVASGVPIDAETARWLAGIGDDLHAKLSGVGLTAARATATARIGDFVTAYIAQRTDAQPRTLLNLKMFGDRLTAFFGLDKTLGEIKRSD